MISYLRFTAGGFYVRHVMDRKILIISAIVMLAVIAVFSCSSDDPAEQIVFTAGEYRGTYSVITDYGTSSPGNLEVDTMKFIFTIATPNTLAIRLDPYDTQDRDFCDWNCNWTLIQDSMLVENCNVYNSICDPDEHPGAKYYHYVDDSKREFIFVKWERDGDDMWRKITLWVP